MGTRRRLFAALAMAIAVIASGCGPSPVDGPTPDPGTTTPGPRPTEAPTFPPPTVEGLAGAIAALDGLASYRFRGSLTDGAVGGESRSTGTVVNGPARRARVEYTTDGAFAGGTITIGTRSWIQVTSTTWREQEGASAVGDEWVNPVARQFDPYGLGIGEVEDLGIEDRGGVAASHYQATVSAEAAVDESGDPIGLGFTGTVDAWIARPGGYLVAARAVGTQVWRSDDEADPAPSASAYVLDVVVEGVDDPANAVDEPPSGPGPGAPADPEAVRLIRGMDDGLAGLGSYAVVVTSTVGGLVLEARITVVNRPSPAAMTETEGIAGFEPTTVVVTPAGTWWRTGTGAWQAGDPDGEPTCVAGADATADLRPCTFARMTDLSSSIRRQRATYTLVATDETVRGTGVTHLRSDAGLEVGEATIAGTRDIWIANAGGHLVKDVFTGDGISFSAVVTRIDDPRNVVVVPGG